MAFALKKLILVTVILMLYPNFHSCGHVLVWKSVSSTSHFILFEAIMHELVGKGHRVTAVMPAETSRAFMRHANVTYVLLNNSQIMVNKFADIMFSGDLRMDLELVNITAHVVIKVRFLYRASRFMYADPGLTSKKELISYVHCVPLNRCKEMYTLSVEI